MQNDTYMYYENRNYGEDIIEEGESQTIYYSDVRNNVNISSSDACELNISPWPVIIMIIIGAAVIIYSAIAPINQDRRIFGVVMLSLWTIIWSVIIWFLWRECERNAAWLLLIVSVVMMLVFFVLIIIMNIGSN